MTLERVVAVLEHARRSGDGFVACCPGHEDAHPSLALEERAGRVLWRCHAGCDQAAVRAALLARGLTPVDLGGSNGHKPARTEYEIRDVDGQLVAVHVRSDTPEGKRFAWLRGGESGLRGLRAAALPLYRSETLAKAEPGAPVIVAEGEKAALAAAAAGFVALGTVTGAASAPGPEPLAVLAGRRVILMPDADTPGREHMARIARSLAGVAAEVRILTWPAGTPEGTDAADLSPERVRQMIAEALEGCARCGREACDGSCPAPEPEPEPTSPAPEVILEPASTFLARASSAEEWLVPGLVPTGGLAMFHGRPRSMKSLAALEVCVACSLGEAPFALPQFKPARPLRVGYISEEDGRNLIAPRLAWMLCGRGMSEAPAGLFLSARRGLLLEDAESQARIRGAVDALELELLWLDTARALAPSVDQGPADAARAVRFLRELLAETSLRGLALVHHDVKPSRDGLDTRARAERSSGGALLAAVDCPVGFERLSERAALAVADRYKVGSQPAPFKVEFQSATAEGEAFREWVRAIGTDTDERAEALARVGPAVLKALEEAGEWLNTAALVEAAGARRADVIAVLGRLVDAQRVSWRPGPRGAREYTRGLAK